VNSIVVAVVDWIIGVVDCSKSRWL
jgi:hypothetical protein